MHRSVLSLLEESEFAGFSDQDEKGIREAAENAIAMMLSGRPIADLMCDLICN
ncbi:MAG: hypothetical protein U1E62_07160 [Alsobacter sp.]